MNIEVDPKPVPMPRFSIEDLQAFLKSAQTILEAIQRLVVIIPGGAAFVPVIGILLTILKLFITEPARTQELMTAISQFV